VTPDTPPTRVGEAELQTRVAAWLADGGGAELQAALEKVNRDAAAFREAARPSLQAMQEPMTI
jgi:hypothetical protein